MEPGKYTMQGLSLYIMTHHIIFFSYFSFINLSKTDLHKGDHFEYFVTQALKHKSMNIYRYRYSCTWQSTTKS